MSSIYRDSTLIDLSELPNRPLVSIKRRRCAAPGPAIAPTSAFGEARPARAGPHPKDTQTKMAHTSRCPLLHKAVLPSLPVASARGHRV